MAASTSTPATPVKPRGKKKILWLVIALVGIGGGAAAPMVLGFGKAKTDAKKSHKTVSIPFGDAVVNLSEDRMTRYLRIKINLLAEEEQEKSMTEHVAKHKAALKNWLISHLSGKTLKEVSGTVGVKKLQREILEKFEEMLYPDGEGHLLDVLFEEFVVQ